MSNNEEMVLWRQQPVQIVVSLCAPVHAFAGVVALLSRPRLPIQTPISYQIQIYRLVPDVESLLERVQSSAVAVGSI
jgi:hypothetical protein